MRDPVLEKNKQKASHRVGAGLSAKLLVLTIVFVMIAEVLIFVPSIANFRNNWLQDRLADAELAVAALDPATYGPSETGDAMMQQVLLDTLQARQLVLVENDRRQVLAQHTGIEGSLVADLAVDVGVTVGNPARAIVEAFGALVQGDRVLRIYGTPEPPNGRFVEVVVDERNLRDALAAFSRNILILSIIISLITALLVYLSLNALFVKPLRRLDTAMANFADNPEDATSIIRPSNRRDELGSAEVRLASMQSDLQTMLSERRRLADVGLAVSKINHDLRNLLTSAHLLSERLEAIDDPHVQRIAPRIVRAIDRAVSFCEATLAYGKIQEAAPARSTFALISAVDEAAEFAGLRKHRAIELKVGFNDALTVRVGRDHLFRVLLNLMRNTRHALEADRDPEATMTVDLQGELRAGTLVLTLTDNGPGIPDHLEETLFQPFQGERSRLGSTGLGLAIARELVEADGGSIQHETPEGGRGAQFVIKLPDAAVGTESDSL